MIGGDLNLCNGYTTLRLISCLVQRDDFPTGDGSKRSTRRLRNAVPLAQRRNLSVARGFPTVPIIRRHE
jgi:hypothetical protein